MIGFKKNNHRCHVPTDVDNIIIIDDTEADPESLGVQSQTVEEIWKRTVDLYKSGVHPAVSLRINRRGQPLISRSIGHSRGNGPKDLATAEKELVTTDTPYCVFSASKAVSGLLIHMLAEDGLINLMDPISFYCPDFKDDGKENITIHQILSHRGGVPGLPNNVPIDDLFSQQKVWRHICKAKPISINGSKLAYHLITGGYIFGQLAEQVTGHSLNHYLDKKIRQPMGMKYFSYGAQPEHRDDLALPYLTGPQPGRSFNWLLKRSMGLDFRNLDQLIDDPRFHELAVPSANLIASANEMTAFYQMMLDGGRWQGKQICEPSTVARAVQSYGGFTFDRTMMMPMHYSAGFMLGGDKFGVFGQHTPHAFGHVGLANKFCWADPERELSVSLLNSGIPLMSSHMLPLIKLVSSVSRLIPRDKNHDNHMLSSF